jgi:hypothetical protein
METKLPVNPATLNDIADTSPSPGLVRNDSPSVERLCEYDEVGQVGCRRTQTIFALEAEFDTFVHPEMFWGYWDQFCQHEGHSYYYKALLDLAVQRDQGTLDEDETNSSLLTHINIVNNHLGRNYHSPITVDYLKGLFTNPPGGFPKLVLETPQFYQCIDLGQDVITIDRLDRDLLNTIKNTFTTDINPLLTDLSNKLHLVDGKVYCSDYTKFENNPSNKLGVLMIAKNTEKYTEGNAYFFPFDVLTTEQQQFVTSLALVELELQGEVVIVNL